MDNVSPKKNGINGRIDPKTGAPPSTKDATIVANLSDCSIIDLLLLFHSILKYIMQKVIRRLQME